MEENRAILLVGVDNNCNNSLGSSDKRIWVLRRLYESRETQK